MSRNKYDEGDDYALRRRPEWRGRYGGWCKCGSPDWPGQCPGWRNCPVHGENEGEEE
jgi:hypothetical protein